MIGRTVSHYKIIEELGRGGMGEVYLAEDLKLERKVAIKFLPQHLTKDKDNVERFEREAKAAASLNHPNIVTIYEISEEDDQTFIVMEYVEGTTLREAINSNSKFPITNYANIISQIAEGLSKAHQADIVHRDIKPENILIDNDGRVKILDFGLAKLKGVSKLTKETSTLGTIYYMSPEQLQGKEVDNRSDIWSLGVVVYEMLTGEVPFQGSYEQAVMYSILNEEPATIKSIISDIPEYFNSLIGKVLQKNPANRYQSIEELLKVIKTSTISSTQPDKKEISIIVLPFDDLSPDKDNEYFSDGLTEEIITDLSHIHDLLVISRSSAMTFKGTKKKIKEIAREVNVQYVLEGSVRKAGNNLRITAQLIDAASDAHLWAEKYSGTLNDVFDIQEKVSRSIVDALKLKLSPEENQTIGKRPIENIHAYECYLRARYEIWRWTEEGLNNALQHLQNGLEIVGENAVIIAGMGYVYYQYVNMGLKVEELYLKKAEEYAKRALEIDPESPLGHIVIGLRKGSWGGKVQEGIRHFKRALTILPNDYDATIWLISYYAHLGKTEAANSYIEKLKKIDPLNPWAQYFPGFVYMWEGQFDLALKLHEKNYELYPYIPPFRLYYALNLAYNHRIDEACSHFEGTAKEQPNALFYKLGVVLALALNEKKKEVFSSLEKSDVEAWASRNFAFFYFVAECYALIDEKEIAIDWLEISVNCGLINYPFLNECDPFLENIRSEARFKKLMIRVKHEWENFEV